jgi:hypothetical protein
MGRRGLPWSAPLAGAVTATVFALSGCGGSSAVSSVVDPVAEAARASELAPGFKVSMSEQLTAGSKHDYRRRTTERPSTTTTMQAG